MGDDITIGVTEIVNNIEVTAQPNDQIVDISVIDNADDVTLNITPTVIEINVNKGSSYAKWGTILGTLSDQTDLQNALDLKANLVGGKVPASELPSYVDDVVEVANYAALPTTGETGKIYVTLDNNKIYRWSGSVYIEIAANNAIWGAITGTLSNQTDLQSALDAKQNTITLTTSGTTGAATLVGSTLNIPNYTTDISGLVPYTGATTNVDLGAYKLTASDLVINHASGSGVAASITKGGNGEALTVVKSSGSGNAASITGGVTLLSELHLTTSLADTYIASAATWNAKQDALNGTGFVKISGTTISYDNSTYALDNAVVHLTGNETISGTKTFSSILKSGLLFINETGGFGNIAGFSQLGGTADYFQVINGANSKSTKFIHNGGRSLTMPATDGTLALTSQLHDAVTIGTANGLSLSTQVLSLGLASSSANGALSSTDWNTFNNKQNALTNPITGTGTTNKLPKFTGSTTISDSNITDNGTVVSISTNATINNVNIGVGSGSATGFSTTVGASALISNTTGSGNTAIGHSTLLFNTTGSNNTANGMFALKANISGNDNTSIGFNTLLSNTTGLNNTAVGSNAILAFTTGSNNTAIGYAAGGNAISSSSNNVYLGNRAGSNSFVTENNKLYIANAAGTPLIGGDFSAKTITIDGTITATSIIKSGGTSSQYLMADGSVSTLTNPVTASSATANYHAKFTGSGYAIGNSIVWDNGTNVGIGTTSPAEKLHVMGNSIFNNSSNNGTTLRFVSNSNSLYGDAFILSPFSNCIFSSNITYNSASGYVYDKNGYGASVRLSGGSTNNGDIFFNTFTSGTAGATATELNRMTILNGGNVGIGTTSPAALLHLATSSGNGSAMRFESTSTNGRIYGIGSNFATGNGEFAIYDYTANAERMRITSSGNVGIGTTSPTAKLSITGGSTSTSISNVATTLTSVFNTANPAISLGIGYVSSDIPMIQSFNNSSNTQSNLTINPFGGNVGIGTTSPSEKLVVGGSSGAVSTPTAIRLDDTYRTGGDSFNNLKFYLYKSATETYGLGLGDVSDMQYWAGTTSTGTHRFFTSQTERMRITSGGNVGIGDSNPNRKLSVLGGSGNGIVVQGFSGVTNTNFTGLGLNTGYGVSYIVSNNASGAGADLYISGSGINISTLGTGTVYSNGGFLTNTNPSDKRLKDNINDLQYGLNEILKLRPVSYNWKNDTANQGIQFGFIAQEVEGIMPDLINEFTTIEDEEKVVRLGLDKEAIFVTLVNAIKEQNIMLQELKAEIEILKNK